MATYYSLSSPIKIFNAGNVNLTLDNTLSATKWSLDADGFGDLIIGNNAIADILNITSAGDVESSGFLFVDAADDTKQMKFDLTAVTPGNTRVVSVPDEDITLTG